MSPDVLRLPRSLQVIAFEEAAQDYSRNLPLEHFMESTAQAAQRSITLASLALVTARRPEVQVFNELLVQYLRRRGRPLGQVVPDNMIVLSEVPIRASSSFNLPLQSARPFWMLEYASKSNKRKDHEESFEKYERDLKVPYYLVFHPDEQELTLFRHNGRRYVSMRPNGHGRHAVQQLDIEVGLLDGWVRFWYEGRLLPLPADLQRDLVKAQKQAAREKRRADAQQRRAEEQQRRAEEEQRRAEELQRQLQAFDEARQAAERELAQLRRQRNHR
jgi:Uma2 family endonuclease